MMNPFESSSGKDLHKIDKQEEFNIVKIWNF